MDDYESSGRKLQFEVMQAEASQLSRGLDHYTQKEIAQATVHARQDLVLMVAQLTQLNGQIRSLRRIMLVGLVVAGTATIYVLFVR